MSDSKEMDEIEIDLTSTDFQVSVNSLDPSGNKKLHLVLTWTSLTLGSKREKLSSAQMKESILALNSTTY